MSIIIHNKEYVTVNERLAEFRNKYPQYNLVSEIVSLTNDSCVMIAKVIDEVSGVVKATGHAQEDRTSSNINKTSYVENCETSAWGRALANLGIGIESSVASAEEVEMAIAKQELLGGNYIFTSGKHKNKTIEQVYGEEPDYLQALLESDQVVQTIKNNIKDFLENK